MEFSKIEATVRTTRGKEATSRLRREGVIPAVAYGNGHNTSMLTISPKELKQILGGPYGRNMVVEVSVPNEQPFPTLVCDFEVHPLTRDLLHVDFLRIDLEKEVDVDVPMITSGKSKGVVAGGVLRQIFRTLPVRCLPKDIPVAIDHDVTELDMNELVKVGDLTLPEGVSVRLPKEQTLVTVAAQEAEADTSDKTAQEGEEAAAPAAAPAAS